MEQEVVSKKLLERFLPDMYCIRYMQNFDQFVMTQKKLSLGFLFTDLFQHLGIYMLTVALKRFIHE